MKGFEVSIGKKLFSVSAGTLVISLDVFFDEKVTLRVSGTCPTSFDYYTFCAEVLHIGDTVTIKVKEVRQSIPPQSTQKADIDYLLRSYHSLKQELEKAKIL
jgi:hypothetical protein